MSASVPCQHLIDVLVTVFIHGQGYLVHRAARHVCDTYSDFRSFIKFALKKKDIKNPQRQSIFLLCDQNQLKIHNRLGMFNWMPEPWLRHKKQMFHTATKWCHRIFAMGQDFHLIELLSLSFSSCELLRTYRFMMQTGKTVISLHNGAGWSGSSLFAMQ